MSDINTYANETAIAGLSPINGDLVLNQDNNSLYLCTNADASGIARWKTFANDGVAEAEAVNRWVASFDGTSEYINIPHDPSLTIAGDLSISAWVYRDSTDASYLPILAKRSSSAAETTYQFYLELLGYGGSLRFYNGFAAHSPSGGTSIPTNQWAHVAITIESGVSNGTKWYVNGTAESGTDTFTINNSNTAAATIGRLGSTGNVYAKGKIDEVALFDTALSAADITAIYNGTAPNGKPTNLTLAASYDTDRTANLKGYWRMGDDSNDSPVDAGDITGVTDSSGTGNHATTVANSQPSFSALTSSETIYV